MALMVESKWSDRVLLWLAISAGAILLERATSRKLEPTYFEDKEQ